MRRFLRGVGWFLLLSFILSVVLRFFLVEVAEVGHDDMVPTLRQGDQVAVWTLAKLERGDVVVCEHPSEPGRRVIGRLLGMPGDTLSMSRGGKLTIGGTPVGTTAGEPRTVPFPTPGGTPRTLDVVRETLPNGRTYLTAVDAAARTELREVRVESGYYLLSDQRSYAMDSRRFGEVPPGLCKGRAVLVLLPADAADGTSRGLFPRVE